MLDAFEQAVGNIFSAQVLLTMLLSAAYGIFVGSIPGLTATMAVALMVPITFFLDDVSAIAAIVTLEACSIFAGDIPTTLVRIPGTPSSAAYTDDAYALNQRGLHERSLVTSLVFSVTGGLFGAVVLIAAAPQLATIAFEFTTYEYFWLYVLGLSCAAFVSHGHRVRGALALFIGLLLSTVGLSEVHSVPRFTFGRDELITGINFIPAMIGLFGISEVLRTVISLSGDQRSGTGTSGSPEDGPGKSLLALVRHVLPTVWIRKISALRSAVIGCVVGMIPGAGADIGAWISYAASKRTSKTPEEYGTGSLEAIADSTTANNSALAGAWIPALVFGIPGDSVTAILIGVLLMKNIQPGPEIFASEQQASLVYSIYVAFLVANILLIPIGLMAIKAGSILIRIPRRVLMPLIVVFSIVGSFAISGSPFDVWVMLAMGLLGFALDRLDVPLGPVVLGIILGGKLEQSFIQNVTKDSSLLSFIERPLSLSLALLCVGIWALPIVSRVIGRVSRRATR